MAPTWSLSVSVSLILLCSRDSFSSYWVFRVWIFFWLISSSSMSFSLMDISVDKSAKSPDKSDKRLNNKQYLRDNVINCAWARTWSGIFQFEFGKFKTASPSGPSRDVRTWGLWLQWIAHVFKTQGGSCHKRDNSEGKYFAVLGHSSVVSTRLKLKTATITGQFKFVFELISGREITFCLLF